MEIDFSFCRPHTHIKCNTFAQDDPLRGLIDNQFPYINNNRSGKETQQVERLMQSVPVCECHKNDETQHVRYSF